MRIYLEKAIFLKALTRQQTVIEKRKASPILGQLLLQASLGTEKAGLTLMGTDLELTLQETMDCIVEEEGCATAPAHLMHDVVKCLPDTAPVHVHTVPSGAMMIIESGNATFELPTLPVEEFPKLEDLHRTQGGAHFCVESNTLRRLVDRTRFAMSNDDARYHLNGIYLHQDNGKIWCAVATDAHRLAFACEYIEELPENVPAVILSRKTIYEVRKLLEDSKGSVMIAIAAQHFSMKADRMVLLARILDGNFPNYRQAIPIQHPYAVCFNTEALSAAVTRVSRVINDRVWGMKFTFDANNVILKCESPSYGKSQEGIVASYSGPSCTIGLNARYVLDVLANIKSPETSLQFKDAIAPIMLKDTTDENVCYLIMPMRI